MRTFLTSLLHASVLCLAAGTAFSQDTGADTTPTDDAAAAGVLATDPTISMGEEVKEDIGQPFVRETHGDWELRCIRVPEGQKEPCQLYQLLRDQSGNPVSEINVFFISSEQGDAAGATVVTPLDTLLTPQLRLTIDGANAKRYPFAWCATTGCFSRLGFAPEDISNFKRGAQAEITIVPLQAPNTEVSLKVSLTGFTAGFDALVADVKAQ